ncbi:MAG: DUF4349 domain-containing protein [Anaerolineae bacterium]|nr:DUF4349 domain-containing protein [Thermoflexales bacterium]MDW8395299.1 DUF4349 domain-containing protein [Anaerolineae bacterium]
MLAKSARLLFALSAVSVLSACAPSAAPMAAPEAGFAPVPAMPTVAVEARDSGNANAEMPSARRLVIRTADMEIVVTDTVATMNELSKLAAETGGFVVSSSTSQVEQRALRGAMTLRVEAKRFDEALSRIRALALEVRSENVRGEDVTAEYVDLDARVKALEASEAQLYELLKSAQTTEDVLKVRSEITRLRSEIDSLKGRIRYLSQAAALSTITVAILPDVLAQPVQVAGWRPEGEARRAVEALIAILQGLGTLFIWTVIVVVPVLAVLALPVVLVVALIYRIRRRENRAPQPDS